MGPVFAIAQAVMADAIRRKILWVVFLFSALLAFAVPSLPSYGGDVVAAVYREVSIALMFTATLVAGLAMAVTRIPNEVERRTVFNVLARDIKRWHYILGTWLGMFAVTGAVLLAFVVVSIGTGYLSYRLFMPILFEAGFAVWFEAGVVMALAVLVSTRFSPATSVVAALAFLFVGHSVNTLLFPAGNAPAWLPSLEIFNLVNPVAHGNGVTAVYAVAMLVAFVGWVALLLLGASASFARRDL